MFGEKPTLLILQCFKMFHSNFDFRLCLNDGTYDAELADSGMRNTLPIVCTRQYPVITGVLKIGSESRVTRNFEFIRC